ncbi:WW domain-binding protein 4 [Belonocnema kinseyi]|uniref:WW domain-binding protein 4 n=1 Tax=Belonocnema kinseyi TaxID=2817044 RepID=UPI00143D18E1|nr:WW domain-binding protein 4 [Belonocnema kinseyi]XP_033224389.1 WW domain-binding protein 4 [Belonocnema kinseyi]XP_033224390.1 WW domain-binding protein 4 [Belonocnema kinseyi]
MADYWKSQGRKFCDFCKCWLADNKPSIEFHEGGKKHKENVEKKLKEIRKNSTKQAKQQKKFEDDIQKMESAAMAAYLKDVESNTKDLTAESIILQKKLKPDTSKAETNPNQMPSASAETNPRFQNTVGRNFSHNVDPFDLRKKQKPPSHPKGNPNGGGQSKQNKKQKSKTTHEGNKGITKRWYEAQSPEGYSYYWNIETNETSWEVPEEGFMSISEQEEEAKEQKIQEELFKQLEVEEAKGKAEILLEQKANSEREKLKEIKKLREVEKADEEEEKIPYRRDYSVPEKPQPYGSWTTVNVVKTKPIDWQLPTKKEAVAAPTLQIEQPPPSQRVFKEKTVKRIITGSDDEEEIPSTFKKRNFGQKKLRKRISD